MPETSVRDQVGEIVSSAKRRVGLERPSAADADGNVGIVRGALRAFGEGDIDGFVDALKEDVTWEGPTGKHFPGAGSYEGRDAVREKFIADVGRTFSEFGFHPESFLEAEEENSVVVFGRFQGEGVEGKGVDTPGVQVWELEGNAVASIDIVTDSAAFPEVVTERKQQEWEREKEEKEEGERESDEPSATEDR
jgi:ketosteroid isomerase-like protein